MRIFAEAELRPELDAHLHDLHRTVYAEDKDRLLNVNEPDYVKHLVSRYCIEPIVLHEDRLHVTSQEQMVRGESFPRGYDTRRGAAYRKQVITYHLPFSGEPRLLRLAPSSRIVWSMDAEIRDHEILFNIVNWQDDPEQIKREAEGHVRNIAQQRLPSDHARDGALRYRQHRRARSARRDAAEG